MLRLSTLFIAANWLVFIYAVINGQVLQASLGYFINPLVNVLLGVVTFVGLSCGSSDTFNKVRVVCSTCLILGLACTSSFRSSSGSLSMSGAFVLLVSPFFSFSRITVCHLIQRWDIS